MTNDGYLRCMDSTARVACGLLEPVGASRLMLEAVAWLGCCVALGCDAPSACDHTHAANALSVLLVRFPADQCRPCCVRGLVCCSWPLARPAVSVEVDMRSICGRNRSH